VCCSGPFLCNPNPLLAEGHEGEAAARIAKGIPVGRPARVDLRNAHLSYVITWSVLFLLSSIAH
jgi:surfeit locus 1 family protein